MKGGNCKMCVLEEINEIREYFKNLKADITATSELEAIDSIINVFSTIIRENSEKEAHKNIGTKINKFNYEKYISCKNALDEINKTLKEIANIRIEGTGSVLLKIKIEKLKEVEKEVIHKISTYEKGQKA